MIREWAYVGSLVVVIGSGIASGIANADDTALPHLQDAGAVPVPDEASRGEPVEGPDAPTQRSKSRLIEEIIVTAQKREENLADVPISVQAFSQESLDARGVADMKDLPQVTPGLTITPTGGYTITFLRGVGSDAFLLGDPSVALYIDNIYFPFAHGAAQGFGAIERVEILKGPQGTLFGRNANGGAINIVTKKPDFTASSVEFQSSYGSYDQYYNRVNVNIPLLDNLAVSASGYYNNEEQYLNGGIGTPEQAFPREVAQGGRVRLRWSPVDNVDVTMSAFRMQQSGMSTVLSANSDPSPLLRPLITPETGYTAESNEPIAFKLDNTVLYGDGSWHTDAFDMKLIGSDQKVRTYAFLDYDGSRLPVASYEGRVQGANVKTAELQFISNDDSWGSDWLKWIAGIYYFKARQGFWDLRLTLGGTDLERGYVLGLPIPSQLFDPIGQALNALPTPLPVSGGTLRIRALVDNDSLAEFAQATATVTDWFSITVGGRYQVEKRSLVESSTGVSPYFRTVQCYGEACPRPGFDDSRVTKSFKPKVSFDFRPQERTLVYASWQQALKTSAVNAVNIYDRPDFVKPETINAYEIGVKTQMFDGLMSLNTAAFHYDIDQLQVQFISLLQGGAVTFENAGKAQIDGVDFDAVVQVLPSLTDGLVLTASGAYLNARYTDYKGGTGFDPVTRIVRSNFDFTGNRIVRTPRFSGTVGLSQTLNIPGGSLEVGGDVFYTGEYSYQAQGAPFDMESAYTLVGAHMSYLYEPWNMRVTLFGKNLTDVTYNYSRLVLDLGTLDSKAPPRTLGVRVNWAF